MILDTILLDLIDVQLEGVKKQISKDLEDFQILDDPLPREWWDPIDRDRILVAIIFDIQNEENQRDQGLLDPVYECWFHLGCRVGFVDLGDLLQYWDG